MYKFPKITHLKLGPVNQPVFSTTNYIAEYWLMVGTLSILWSKIRPMQIFIVVWFNQKTQKRCINYSRKSAKWRKFLFPEETLSQNKATRSNASLVGSNEKVWCKHKKVKILECAGQRKKENFVFLHDVASRTNCLGEEYCLPWTRTLRLGSRFWHVVLWLKTVILLFFYRRVGSDLFVFASTEKVT